MKCDHVILRGIFDSSLWLFVYEYHKRYASERQQNNQAKYQNDVHVRIPFIFQYAFNWCNQSRINEYYHFYYELTELDGSELNVNMLHSVWLNRFFKMSQQYLSVGQNSMLISYKWMNQEIEIIKTCSNIGHNNTWHWLDIF